MPQVTYLFGKLIIESFSFFSKFVSEMLLSTGSLMIPKNELDLVQGACQCHLEFPEKNRRFEFRLHSSHVIPKLKEIYQ